MFIVIKFKKKYCSSNTFALAISFFDFIIEMFLIEMNFFFIEMNFLIETKGVLIEINCKECFD